MDTRLTTDQAELFDTIGRLTADLAPAAVGDLDDAGRRDRLVSAVEATGVWQLREKGDGAAPLASGVEAALVAEALGAGPADAAYLGPLLAGDLWRRAGQDHDGISRTVGLAADLSRLATTGGGALDEPALAIDAAGADRALVLVVDEAGTGLAEVELGSGEIGTDLTRRQVRLDQGSDVRQITGGRLDADALAAWNALGLAVSAADAVGAMRGAVALAVEYAAERQQYGAPVGSFQAVQHLLAEAHTLVEGSLSTSRHAAWAVDALDPGAALSAAAVATAYVGRAGRTVGETVIQVHGGIGNTWECMAHVFHRRVLHDEAVLGGAGSCLAQIASDRMGAA